MNHPQEFSKWSLDGLPVVVAGVRKKGRGYFVVWASEHSNGRTPLKEWNRKAIAAD